MAKSAGFAIKTSLGLTTGLPRGDFGQMISPVCIFVLCKMGTIKNTQDGRWRIGVIE